jgi:hypothetical protein
MPKSTPPPESAIAPPSILGSRTTRTAFILVAISLAVVLGALLFVLLRDPPEIPGAKPSPSASASASAP